MAPWLEHTPVNSSGKRKFRHNNELGHICGHTPTLVMFCLDNATFVRYPYPIMAKSIQLRVPKKLLRQLERQVPSYLRGGRRNEARVAFALDAFLRQAEHERQRKAG